MPDKRDVARVHLGRIAADLASARAVPCRCSTPAACRERFRWADVSGVFISACASIQIRPIFLSCACDKCVDTPANGPDGDRMISAQYQWDAAFGHRAAPPSAPAVRTGLGDLRKIARIGRAFGQHLRLLDRSVAKVLNLVAERRSASEQVGHAHGRRTHIDAAATGAQVERRADDGDGGMGAWASCRGSEA